MLITDEHALIGHENGQLQLIEPDTAHTIRQMNGHTGLIRCIEYCPELSRVITGSDDMTARVWNVATSECVHVLNRHSDLLLSVAVHCTTYVNCSLLIIG
jgi:WD40 repeat protein